VEVLEYKAVLRISMSFLAYSIVLLRLGCFRRFGNVELALGWVKDVRRSLRVSEAEFATNQTLTHIGT
jgi:hypothetical protein